MHHLYLVVRDQATLVTLMITKKKLCEFPAQRNAPKNLQIFNHKSFLKHGLWLLALVDLVYRFYVTKPASLAK